MRAFCGDKTFVALQTYIRDFVGQKVRSRTEGILHNPLGSALRTEDLRSGHMAGIWIGL